MVTPTVTSTKVKKSNGHTQTVEATWELDPLKVHQSMANAPRIRPVLWMVFPMTVRDTRGLQPSTHVFARTKIVAEAAGTKACGFPVFATAIRGDFFPLDGSEPVDGELADALG